MDDFITFLETRLNRPLPGITEQLKMAPDFNPNDRLEVPTGVRHNGVIILLHSIKKKPDIIYTLRSNKLQDHSGQICFPGGSTEQRETLEETAIRELKEEIGISLNANNIIGKLTPLYVPPSQNLIHPFIAYQKVLPKVTLQPAEVSEVYRTSLDDLINPDNIKKEIWNYKGRNVEVPFWTVHRVPLWGATAMITSELTALYKEYINAKK